MDMDDMDAAVGTAPFSASQYGRIFWYSLLAFFVLGASFSWSLVLIARRRRRNLSRDASTGYYFTLVSIVREASYLQFSCFGILLPTQGQINACLIYTALLLSCLLSQVWTEVPVFWEAISMRAAYLSLAQLVLVVALAAKKNFVAYFFATSHERINVFHRYVSVCMLLTTTMHMGYFMKEWLFYDVWASQWKTMGSSVLVWGFAAWGVLLFINATSISLIRHRLYTYWLPLHIASMFALVILVGRHVMSDSRVWLYVVAGLFFLDRVLRVASRLNNMDNRWTKAGAIVEALPGNAIRITVPNQTLPFQKVGQYAYLSLYQFGIHSHPFTISTTPKSGQLVFLLKSKTGLTRLLHDRAKLQLPPAATMRYSLEGPYGGTHLSPAAFDTVLLVAGGVGASFVMSLLSDLTVVPGCCRRVQFIWVVKEASHLVWFEKQIEEAFQQAKRSSIELEVHVHITCDEQWSDQELKSLDPPPTACNCKDVQSVQVTEVYAEKEHSAASSISTQEITQQASLIKDLTLASNCCCSRKSSINNEHTVRRFCGRPDMQRLVLRHLLQDERKGESGIFACGPAAMTQELRSAVVRASDMLAVKKGSGKEAVYLHIENQY